MLKLKEIHDKYFHFYQDSRRRIQGEYKWWCNGKSILTEHSLYKDGKRHGEFKSWTDHGVQVRHCFYQHDEDITEEIKELVSDIKNITHKEKVLIKLKFGIECLI